MMNHGETIQDFMSRVLDFIYRIRMVEKDLLKKVVVLKILRSLNPRFTHVVSSIIEAKNLNTLIVDELSGSLKSHESILNLSAR